MKKAELYRYLEDALDDLVRENPETGTEYALAGLPMTHTLIFSDGEHTYTIDINEVVARQ